MEETRNRLRRAMIKRRSALSPATCLAWSRAIQTRALEHPQYVATRSVALYRAIQNEVETGAIMDHAFRHNKKVFCPKVSVAGAAAFVQVSSEEDFRPGPLGVLEPSGDLRLSHDDCAGLVVMVPGVLFDGLGNRLGRGGGWYDRALRWFYDRGVFFGLAYEFQVIDRVPVQSWDEKLHYVITESRVIDCGLGTQQRIAR